MKIGWSAAWAALPWAPSPTRGSDIASPPQSRTDGPTIRIAWRRTDTPDAARALLAELLAPLGWDGALERTPLGAPRSDWLEARGLSVSLSHTTGLAACAVIDQGMVGVDVEAVDSAVDVMAVAVDRLDRQAVADLATAPDRQERFFVLWTLTEAAMKAVGVGFSAQAGITVSLDPPAVRGETPAGFAWRVFTVEVGPTHRMAVVALTPKSGPEPALEIAVAA